MADSKEEQARKARAFAENCFLAGNLHGARQWMLSAARLTPNLPGNAEAAAAYDVHDAAARGNLLLGAPDWYAVLGLPSPGSGAPPPTRDAVKKQHRRLCLLVHPDKNPSAAADGAFKLVQAAWEALSAAPAAPARRPPPPPPQAPPQRPPDPPRRPHVAQMPRRAAPPPQRGRTSRVVPPPPVPPRAPSPPVGKCRACGAHTTSGKRSFRCLSCHWSPMDELQDDDEDDYYGDHYDYDF
ncbi:hypothetical protein ACP4OV_008717 [Aristida adscensionis]